MLTSKDIDKLVQFFASKNDLNHLEEKLVDKLATKDQHDQVMNKLDWIVGSLKRLEEENLASQPVHDRLDERLKKVESKVFHKS